MTAVIVSTPFGTRPYRPPNLKNRLCPWTGDVCVGEACAAWLNPLLGCSLVLKHTENVQAPAPTEPSGYPIVRLEKGDEKGDEPNLCRVECTKCGGLVSPNDHVVYDGLPYHSRCLPPMEDDGK